MPGSLTPRIPSRKDGMRKMDHSLYPLSKDRLGQARPQSAFWARLGISLRIRKRVSHTWRTQTSPLRRREKYFSLLAWDPTACCAYLRARVRQTGQKEWWVAAAISRA